MLGLFWLLLKVSQVSLCLPLSLSFPVLTSLCPSISRSLHVHLSVSGCPARGIGFEEAPSCREMRRAASELTLAPNFRAPDKLLMTQRERGRHGWFLSCMTIVLPTGGAVSSPKALSLNWKQLLCDWWMHYYCSSLYCVHLLVTVVTIENTVPFGIQTVFVGEYCNMIFTTIYTTHLWSLFTFWGESRCHSQRSQAIYDWNFHMSGMIKYRLYTVDIKFIMVEWSTT